MDAPPRPIWKDSLLVRGKLSDWALTSSHSPAEIGEFDLNANNKCDFMLKQNYQVNLL